MRSKLARSCCAGISYTGYVQFFSVFLGINSGFLQSFELRTRFNCAALHAGYRSLLHRGIKYLRCYWFHGSMVIEQPLITIKLLYPQFYCVQLGTHTLIRLFEAYCHPAEMLGGILSPLFGKGKSNTSDSASS